MRGHDVRVRGERRIRRQAALAALALCGTLALTACNGDDGDGAAGAPGATPATSAPATTAATPPAASPTPSKSAKKPSASATPADTTKAPAPGSTCDHKMPISPDEIAVNRYTPEGGAHSLILKHGNWGCKAPGSDVAPFETVGEETYLNIAEDAKITAVTPIVASPVSLPITLHELTEWLIAHPNQGRVFRYHLDAKGVIDSLDQQYTGP